MTFHGDIGNLRHGAAERRRDGATAQPEEQSRRLSRWAVVVYVVVTLATPLLLYAGPDVMSPAAPAIADAARDGELSMHARPIHANVAAPANVR